MRRLITFFVFLFLSPTTPSLAQGGMNYVKHGEGDNLIVFIHGFLGNPRLTFKYAKAKKSWLDMVSEDDEPMRSGPPLSSYGVAAIGYPAGIFSKLRLEDLAERVRVYMEDAGAFDKYKNIHIVSYSLGGLVAKRTILLLRDKNESHFAQVKSIFLIAVPSRGSPHADYFKRLLDFGKAELPKDLQTTDTNQLLRAIENDWRNVMLRKDFPVIFCAYELDSTFFYGKPVPEIYTSTTCHNTPRAEAANHETIVKPESRSASIYQWVRGRIGMVHSKLARHNAAPSEDVSVHKLKIPSKRQESDSRNTTIDYVVPGSTVKIYRGRTALLGLDRQVISIVHTYGAGCGKVTFRLPGVRKEISKCTGEQASIPGTKNCNITILNVEWDNATFLYRCG